MIMIFYKIIKILKIYSFIVELHVRLYHRLRRFIFTVLYAEMKDKKQYIEKQFEDFVV